ncbi:hypothetical protein [Enterococcus sp. 7E2_DIV0204]|nr:hypothetical protein [Enterococcus sp. 7E2_DIV0204]
MNALNEQLLASKADVEKQIEDLEGIEDKYFALILIVKRFSNNL